MVRAVGHDHETGYWVSFADYPDGADTSSSEATRRVVDAVAERFHAQVGGTAPFDLHGHQGLSASFQRTSESDPLVGQANAVFVGKRLYQLVAYSKHRAGLLDPSMQAFFSSFDLL